MRPQAPIIAIKLLKNAIHESGLSDAAIAFKSGISEKTFATAKNGWLITPRLCRRVEVALDRAIWTPAPEFARQQLLTAWLGFDPFITSRVQGIARARQKSIAIKGVNPSRALVLAHISAAFDAAHPAPAAKPPRRAKMNNPRSLHTRA